MTNEELAEIRAYVAERAAARARGEHIDSDERREAALLDELEEVMGDLYQLADRAERVWREMGYHTAAISQSGRSSLDALRAALDATPEETRAAVGARERALADRDVMKRELDEAREEAAQWKRLAEQTTDARLAEAIASREVMQRERDEVRRELLDLDLVLPAACGSRVDAARQLEADLDEARTQLAALHAAASAVQTKARALPVSMTEIVHAEEWDDLDRVLADLATADRRARGAAGGGPMTDLCEALRAAMTPDGRVRLTRELLTAMHEEGERRERGESVEVWRERAFAAEGALTVRLAVRREIEEALGMVPGLTDDQALQRGLDAVRMLRERAEKAERELGEARARIEAAGNVVSDNGCDCACDHSTLHEDHDEDCEVCVVCRVADALWPEAGR